MPDPRPRRHGGGPARRGGRVRGGVACGATLRAAHGPTRTPHENPPEVPGEARPERGPDSRRPAGRAAGPGRGRPRRAASPAVGRVVRHSGGRPVRRPGGHAGTAGHARSVSGAGGGVRLTRRGRVVLISFAAVLLLLLLWLTAGPWARAGSGGPERHGQDAGAGTGAGSRGHRVEHVVVEPGDTLWGIAVRTSGDADPRVTVQRIIDANGLSGPIVQPGQRLRLPAR